jgi:type IV pilus assembly protein PilW
MTARPPCNVQRGFSLIEIMVGIVIGMIAVLVIYQVFAAAEGIKRNTTSVGDAQQNGLLSSFMLGIELANGSNGVADAMAQLGNCTAGTNAANSLRPIPILISDGGGDTTPDTFVVNYSVAQRRVTAAPVVAQGGTSYTVQQSPLGFANNDLIIAIPSSTGDCAASRVTSVTGAPSFTCPATDQSGCVTLSVAATVPAAYVLNMGPTTGGVVQRVQYDVNAGVLRSTVLWNTDGQAVAQPPNPIASNIVNMKLLYGVDNGAGGITWTPATGQWLDANVLAANNSTVGKIRAVRIGIIVRGEQWDKTAGDVPWQLFDGAVQLNGTFPAAGGNYRYRTYETTIPLRNSLFNPVS